MTRGGGGHAIVLELLVIFDLVVEVFWGDA